MLAPGSTIGILGGGQLGRMLAIAAAQLGYRVHVYTPQRDSVAAEVAAEATVAPFTDPLALHRFAIALRTAASTRSDTSGRSSRTDGGSSLMCRIATATKFSPGNGTWLVSSS